MPWVEHLWGEKKSQLIIFGEKKKWIIFGKNDNKIKMYFKIIEIIVCGNMKTENC